VSKAHDDHTAGKDIFCEKPISRTIRDVQTLRWVAPYLDNSELAPAVGGDQAVRDG